MSFARELDTALGWLKQTRAIALDTFSHDVAYKTKGDGTPVTEADTKIEATLRELIVRSFPGDAILGEEEGLVGSGPRRWIVDPIDGTQNFRRGIPVFATLIALEDAGGLAVGIADAPALGQTWWATRGGGAHRDGSAIRVSSVASLADAHVACGGIDTIRQEGLLGGFVSLCQTAARSRSLGDFWGHVLVAQGSVDAMIDPSVSVWDLAAVRLIVEEAGGRFTSVRGGASTHEAGSALATNGALHDEIVAALTA